MDWKEEEGGGRGASGGCRPGRTQDALALAATHRTHRMLAKLTHTGQMESGKLTHTGQMESGKLTHSGQMVSAKLTRTGQMGSHGD